MLVTILTTLAVVAIIGGAIAYIVNAKRRGVKCIGCPASGSGECHCHCNCNKE